MSIFDRFSTYNPLDSSLHAPEVPQRSEALGRFFFLGGSMANEPDGIGRDDAIELLSRALRYLDNSGDHLAAAYVAQAIEELQSGKGLTRDRQPTS